MSEQGPDFPYPNMPRMGRRNAIVALQENSLPGGSQKRDASPNAVKKSSVTKIENRVSIDPQGVLAHQLTKEVMRQVEIDTRPVKLTPLLGTNEAHPSTIFNASVMKDWKKLHDSNSKVNGIQTILREHSYVSAISPGRKGKKFLSRAAKIKQNRGRSISSDRETENSDIKSTVTVKPWRNPIDDKPATTAEERRKVFESFNLTSVEPPETPQASDTNLKKSSEEKKGKPLTEHSSSESEESLVFPKRASLKADSTQGKGPYADVLPRVNTRWNKWESLTNWKLSSVLDRGIAGTNDKFSEVLPPKVHGGDGVPKISGTARPKLIQAPTSRPNTPIERNKVQANSKLVENYPATESLKNHPATDKLPLTIGPRYNHKKAWRMINGVQNIRPDMLHEGKRFHGSTSSNPFYKLKYDPLAPHQMEQRIRNPPKNSEISPFKSTFYNLQRINHGRIGAATGHGGRGGNITSVGRRRSSLLNFDLVMRRTRSPPIVTTIQAPPSPFLTSNISVYSQMNAIPVNGEALDSNKQIEKLTKFGKGKDSANTSQKKEMKSGGKAPGSYKGYAQNAKAVPQAQKDPNRKTDATAKKITENKTGLNNPKQPHPHSHPPHPRLQPGKPTTKVQNVPKLVSQVEKSIKYSNIYIGPYSGSDSDGEQQNSASRKSV